MIRFLLCILLLTVFGDTCISQSATVKKKPETREEYLKKSRSQRTGAFILLGAGVLAIAAVSNGNSDFGTTGVAAVAGGAAILGSVPLFLAAGRNKRKGMAMQAAILIEPPPFTAQYIRQFTSPALTLKIKLASRKRLFS